jgi:hypothetical protein
MWFKKCSARPKKAVHPSWGAAEALLGSPLSDVLIVDVPPQATWTSIQMIPPAWTHFLVSPLAAGAIKVGPS